MYRRILVPTDGSPVSEAAVDAAIEFVHGREGSEIVALSVAVPEPTFQSLEGAMAYDPGLQMDVRFTASRLGELDTQLVYEFFQGLVNHAGITLHIDNLKGMNAHHQCETIFKAFARALRAALEPDPRAPAAMPSTKGCL